MSVDVFVRCKIVTIEKRQRVQLPRVELDTLLCLFASSRVSTCVQMHANQTFAVNPNRLPIPKY